MFSSLLYASETWLTDQLPSVNKHHLAAVKALLGVRFTTTDVLCLLELGLPDLASFKKKKRTNFMQSFNARSYGEEPLAYALQLCAASEEGRRLQATSTRFSTYLTLNPELDVHPGRWMRIPREQRLCTCSAVIQDETHVIVLHCERTEHLRQRFNMNDMKDFFELDLYELCSLSHKILETFVT